MKAFAYFIPLILFFILSFVIVFPLLAPGYILTMDIAFPPKMPKPDLFSPYLLFNVLLWLSTFAVPTFIFQKTMLFLIFFLSGLSMYYLISKKYGLYGIFGGVFYAINPFVYERVMAGQWQLLLGFSIFPFIISGIINFFDRSNLKNMVILAIWTVIMTNLSLHFLLIEVVFITIYGLTYLFFHQDNLILVAKYLSFLIIVVFIFNINWVLNIIVGRPDLNQIISQFNSNDLVAFQSYPDSNFGLVFNLFSGYGFWMEAYDYFILPKNIVFFWPLLSLMIIGISLYGLIKLSLDQEQSSFPFLFTTLIIFLLSLDFAGGIGLKSFSKTFFYLYDSLPFLRSFREPQKLIGIVIFCYSFFGSIGLYFLLNKAKKSFLSFACPEHIRRILCFLFFILPFIYTPTVFAGFFGQLKPVFYPKSWTEVNNQLNQDKENFLVLFFPWHQYLGFKFNNDKVSVNPAVYFFDKTILSSANYETENLYSHDIRPEAVHVEGLLRIENEGINLFEEPVDEKVIWGEALTPIEVKYIILAKEADWKQYDFLDNQIDLQKIMDNQNLILYKNLNFILPDEAPRLRFERR